MDQDKQSNFDEQSLIKALQQIQGTSKSIEGASNTFIEQGKNGQYIPLMDCYSMVKSECLRVFEIWNQRQSFSQEQIKTWVEKLKSAQSQDEELAQSLPDGLPPIPHELISLATNYNGNLDKTHMMGVVELKLLIEKMQAMEKNIVSD